MGKVHAFLTPAVAEWIGRQQMFTVATAPLAAGGHSIADGLPLAGGD